MKNKQTLSKDKLPPRPQLIKKGKFYHCPFCQKKKANHAVMMNHIISCDNRPKNQTKKRQRPQMQTIQKQRIAITRGKNTVPIKPAQKTNKVMQTRQTNSQKKNTLKVGRGKKESVSEQESNEDNSSQNQESDSKYSSAISEQGSNEDQKISQKKVLKNSKSVKPQKQSSVLEQEQNQMSEQQKSHTQKQPIKKKINLVYEDDIGCLRPIRRNNQFQCPLCQKLDKNRCRLRFHLRQCKKGIRDRAVRKQIFYLKKEKQIGKKLCRYCRKTFNNISSYEKHMEETCQKKKKTSLYYVPDPAVFPRKKGEIVRAHSLGYKSYVVCPYCIRNFHNTIMLYEHVATECIKNPRNPKNMLLWGPVIKQEQFTKNSQNNSENASGKVNDIIIGEQQLGKHSQNISISKQIQQMQRQQLKRSERQQNQEYDEQYESLVPENQQQIYDYKQFPEKIIKLRKRIKKIRKQFKNLKEQVGCIPKKLPFQIDKQAMQKNSSQFYELMSKNIQQAFQRKKIYPIVKYYDSQTNYVKKIRKIDLRKFIKLPETHKVQNKKR